LKPETKLLIIGVIAIVVLLGVPALVAKIYRSDGKLTAAQKRTIEQRARDLAMVGQLEYGVLDGNVLVPVVDYRMENAANMAESSCMHVNGHALYYRISVNERLAAKCFDDVMRYTMPHEVGHLLVCQFSEKWQQHDAEWSNAVRFLGADPQEFHKCTQ
jgi:hypothetical protein